MNRPPKLSVVLPVHNGQQKIAAEVERVLEAVTDMAEGAVEVIIVDDDSRDATAEVLDDLRRRYPQVRLARHRRRLGMEAAGQTGLERATGELVFIQEDDTPLRMADLRQLYQMGRDDSIVAARAQTQAKPCHGPLLRRLRAWGAAAAETLRKETTEEEIGDVGAARGLQMVRRPHLQLLASRGGRQLRLEAEHVTTTAPSIAAARSTDLPLAATHSSPIAG